jgi:glycosyltransferase involved in cell wall biosynthesis
VGCLGSRDGPSLRKGCRIVTRVPLPVRPDSRQRPLRILIDVAAFARGGMERQVVMLASGLGALGHRVLLVVNKAVGAYSAELVDGSVDVIELRRYSRFDVLVVADLWRAIQAFSPDVVLAVNFNATLWGRLAAAAQGRCRVVVAEHTTGRPSRRRLIMDWTNRMLDPRTDAIVACADAQVDSLVREGNSLSKIVVIRNGVDAGSFHPDSSARDEFRSALGPKHSSYVLGLVAGHRPEKRQDRFIDLVERLTARGIDVHGVMVGGGPLIDATRHLAAASRARDRLEVLGARRSMRSVYCGCDVVVLVSDSVETMPLALLEAQACGVPVVTYSVGGAAETLIDGQTGIVVAEGDVGSLVDALADLASDHLRRNAMGAAARQHILDRFTLQRMVHEYEELFMRLRAGVAPVKVI